MKFTIEVDDFWLEEEELSEALTAHIKRDVIRQISEQTKVSVQEQIAAKVQEVIDKKIANIIDESISEFIETGLINVKTGYGAERKELPLKQHLKQVFEGSSGWSNPDSAMQKIAKRFGEEMKARYDNVFAGHIVKGLKEQGMLKQEVVELLLEGKRD